MGERDREARNGEKFSVISSIKKLHEKQSKEYQDEKDSLEEG